MQAHVSRTHKTYFGSYPNSPKVFCCVDRQMAGRHIVLHGRTSLVIFYPLEGRVPTRPGKPGKMRVHLENLEISWNFEIFNKNHGKIIKTWKKFDDY